MPKKRTALSDQVRAAIDDSGLSRYRICKELGIAESTMSRFMNGEGGISMELLDKLAELIDLNLAPSKRRRKE